MRRSLGREQLSKKAAKNWAKNLITGSKVFTEDEVEAGLKPEIFFYQCQVSKRSEEIPIFARKGHGPTLVERKWDYGMSVFKTW